jgi:hypothetical protein
MMFISKSMMMSARAPVKKSPTMCRCLHQALDNAAQRFYKIIGAVNRMTVE